MRINTVSFASAKRPMLGTTAQKPAQKTMENPFSIADIIPASALLGSGLMAYYFIKTGKSAPISEAIPKIIK